jgi:hypothetical protein
MYDILLYLLSLVIWIVQSYNTRDGYILVFGDREDSAIRGEFVAAVLFVELATLS